MSNFEASRPRRAMAPDELVDEFVDDDTPAETTAARRYALEDEADAATPVEPERGEPEQDAAQESGSADSPASPQEAEGSSNAGGLFREDRPVDTANPFARPGSQSAGQPLDTPIPRPVLPSPEAEGPEETTFGRRMGPVAVGPTPAPRRSADSSLTPPEPEPSPQFQASPEPAPASWFEHHRRTLLLWGVGALILAILLAGGIFAFRQFTEPAVSPSPSPTISPSASASPEPEASVEDLLSETDAAAIVPDASWVVTNTATQRSDFPSRAVCLSAEPNNVNPLIALQQTLGTSQSDQLAAMHQIETFTTVETAQTLMSQRIASLSACGGVPAHLVMTWDIAGLGDQALAFSIAYENDPAEYHTLVMVRTGRTLTMLDVVRQGERVSPEAMSQGLLRSLGELCEPSEGTCPAQPEVSSRLPIPGDPVGWLEPWDLPRVTAGAGMWTAGAPGQVSLAGTTCENVPLATEAGPSERAQRTFIMTQDPAAHDAFGVDEIRFTFGDAEGAREFADRLITNIDGCAERLLSAEVEEIDTIEGSGADGAELATTTYLIELETSDEDSVVFQLAVGHAGNHVTYVLATVTEDYRFTDEQWSGIALRAAQRATQA